MTKKILRIVMVSWLLCGIVKLCIFVNPWVFRLAAMTKPQFNDSYGNWEGIDWDSGSTEQIIVVWLLVVGAAALGIVALAVLAAMTEWACEDEEEEGEQEDDEEMPE